MPQYQLVLSKLFEDDFGDLPKKVQGQVVKALGRIRTDPYRGRKLRDMDVGQWRYRIGDYRIRYDIVESAIHLYTVRHRKEVYRA